MDTIKIEKAIFGQVNQGHGLRCFSSNKDFFNKASPLLDLPDVIPSGVNPFPYISGFPLENYYVIAKTFLDVNASRAGMVIVYTLAIPLEEIVYLNEINHLIDLLPNEPINENDFLNQALVFNISRNINVINGYSNIQLAELLVGRKKEPFIHVGHLDFNKSVISIWAILWPSMRKNFIFRLSLRPGDCIEPALPNLVCIPEALVARWNQDYKRINQAFKIESTSSAAQALCSGYNEYKDFIEKFGIQIKNPQSLNLLVQAKEKYTTNFNKFSEFLNLVRFIEVLSPSSTAGYSGKQLLIRQFENLIKGSKIEDILKLRNLKGHGFSNFQVVWQAIVSKIENDQFITDDDHFIIEVLGDALDAENGSSNNWKDSVQLGFSLAFNNLNTSIFLSTWRWLNLNPQLILQLLDTITISPVIEDQLVVHAPRNISKEIEEFLIPFLRDRNLLHLHGLIVGTQYSTLEAFRQQLLIDRDISFTTGLEALTSRAKASELLQACLDMNDERINDIVVRQAAKNPHILKDVNFSSPNSLFIWTKVLINNPEVWNAPKNSQEILFSLLNEYLTSRGSNHVELIRLLSNSPVADLCDFLNRIHIWNLEDKTLCDNFLKQTALGWYSRALESNHIDLDSILEKSVCEIPGLNERLKQDSLYNVKGVLTIFSSINLFSESEFIDWLIFWLNSSSQKIEADMKMIGQIINQNRWDKAATVVFNESKLLTLNLNPILNSCKGLLSIWNRLTLGNVSDNDRWEAFWVLLESLYPKGPDDQDIWARAGGKTSFLRVLGSGRENWRDAIRKIRNGSKPHPSNLIREMKSDFPNNEKVSILGNLF